jgi:hypothetical protein
MATIAPMGTNNDYIGRLCCGYGAFQRATHFTQNCPSPPTHRAHAAQKSGPKIEPPARNSGNIILSVESRPRLDMVRAFKRPVNRILRPVGTFYTKLSIFTIVTKQVLDLLLVFFFNELAALLRFTRVVPSAVRALSDLLRPLLCIGERGKC